MMAHRVLVCESIHERGVQRFEGGRGFEVEVATTLERSELLRVVKRFDALIVRRATPVNEELFAAAPRLRVVGVGGARLDNVDVSAATRRGIAVINTPGRNAIARAEHALSLLMALNRRIPEAAASMKAGKWEKKKFQGREMAGRTLGVVGLGEVGALVCKLASRGLRMQVLGYDPAMKSAVAAQSGAKLAPLDEVLKNADALSIHLPLNERTRQLIDAQAFALMKPGVIVVNCGHCDVVKTEALLEALDSGRVSGAAIDVEREDATGARELREHPGVALTPDLGGATEEAERAIAESLADRIMEFFEEGCVSHAVNMPALDPSQRAFLRPYMDLTRRLGLFLGGLTVGPITGLRVERRGILADQDPAPLVNAALVGLLRTFEGADVNPVNARLAAQERGLQVSETASEDRVGVGPSITLYARLEDGTERSVSGALIETETREPRIIRVDGFVTEAPPVGPMLIVTNRDVPGMIAGVSGAIASHGVNIAQMNLSRRSVGGMALAIINIDEPASDALLDDIVTIEGILSVRQVRLD
jgi:D-3-phosphoglycerate dehydrogenase